MKTNEIISEIRQFREQHAKGCAYDLDRIVDDIRKGEEGLRNSGWKLVARKISNSAHISGKAKS